MAVKLDALVLLRVRRVAMEYMLPALPSRSSCSRVSLPDWTSFRCPVANGLVALSQPVRLSERYLSRLSVSIPVWKSVMRVGLPMAKL